MGATGAEDDVAAMTARTARKYDSLPYQSKSFAQSQPSRLGGLARLFGLEAAPLATARVLELGCASGGNILPLAARYPDARFVGVDLAPAQVDAGQKRIARLGLGNIRLDCRSLIEIGADFGQFDYVICHGVYSWVPPAVQDAIFRVISERLSPVGVACISYNVLPGWRLIQPLRDALLPHIPDGEPLERVAKARELLAFLGGATPDRGAYGDILRHWAARVASLPDDYLAHEFLEDSNQPCTIRDFADAAGRHGLGFLGECDIATMIPDNYGDAAAAQVRARAGDDPVAIEQYLDLLSGRTFRNSVLVAGDRAAAAERGLASAALSGLHFVLQARMRIERGGGHHVAADAHGRQLLVTSDAVADGLDRMVARFPSSSTLGDMGGGGADLLDALHRMLVAGMITVSSEPVEAGTPGDRPVALATARVDAADETGTTTANVRHETVALDPAMRVLLPLLDGTRDHDALARDLATEAAAGRIGFQRDGWPLTDPDAIRQAALEALPSLLGNVADLALLTPAD